MITLTEATGHVDELVAAALAQLPPARADKIAGDPAPCDDPTDGGPPGRVTAVAEYQVQGLDEQDYPQYLDTLYEWWTGHGFQVLADARPGGQYIWVEHKADGYRMAVQANDLGALYLTATSPCVWP
ncbi:hypothetical protein [Actinocrispum wychmicini]|uniref:Uncharacterized protein n=1 Tax=Actinocrispum wychmicini TaxID=1213861 RepID=A0A4R2J272_9PSEU|nr:hypothetical protein [Actinocrispum wychmicini]TCO52371.1 hypothetical protein EV192_112103 [Actinocrispum wychmicini]